MNAPETAGAFTLVRVGVYGTFMVAQLGIVRGTAGANGLGPDPLDGVAFLNKDGTDR